MIDLSGNEHDQALELMYYGFRRLVESPDRRLAELGLNRSHHRIMYFVARRPGLSVGQLLELLEVSKQALNRPLRDLREKRYLRFSTDKADARVRRLELTDSGKRLEQRLTGEQHRHLERVFSSAGPAAQRAWRQVMVALVQSES